jgi:hypothetical protein
MEALRVVSGLHHVFGEDHDPAGQNWPWTTDGFLEEIFTIVLLIGLEQGKLR